MRPVVFESALVADTIANCRITIALFDGHPVPGCVALLECPVETARSFWQRLGSALETIDRAV
jgi:hypothetical protein